MTDPWVIAGLIGQLSEVPQDPLVVVRGGSPARLPVSFFILSAVRQQVRDRVADAPHRLGVGRVHAQDTEVSGARPRRLPVSGRMR
jgi:hypothetical protein